MTRGKSRGQVRAGRLLAGALAVVVALAVLWWTNTPGAGQGESPLDGLALTLERLPGHFGQPVHITHAPDDSERLFVVEKPGRIRIVRDGEILPNLFLDLTGQVSTRFEQGLLSLAFHPRFADNGFFFVNYTEPRGDTVIARYRVDADDPDRADPDSREVVLTISQPAANHNGGGLAFGPDGYLYIGTGDGGRGGDPWGNAQNPGTLLGKMLRIDVDGDQGYSIPADNPFVDDPDTQDEIWAMGLRNPWRYAFDRETGDLYIADVGQSAWEEINVQPADSRGGENYGWNIMEGTHCYPPGSSCNPAGLVLPVAEYPNRRTHGCSITGGHVYRGDTIDALAGVYLFGDFCTGRIWALHQSDGEWTYWELMNADMAISSFGEDAAGEIYIADISGGAVYRLAALP